MDFVDYYNTLGIAKTATVKEIKNAYRKLARKYHPDLNPNNKDAKKNFQKINEANEVLSDPVKRRKYDKYGEDWQHSEQFERADQFKEKASNTKGQKFTTTYPDGDFSSFFESMFGSMPGGDRNKQFKYRGEDFNTELHLSLIDAYSTHKKSLSVNGENIRITIPAGIENGQTIKIAGHGGHGINGGPNGDLYITFSISNHPKFKRSGTSLYTSVDLDLYTAVLGGEIVIDTLNGKVKLKVKPEMQNGTKVKLKNKGFPYYKNEGQFGDLFVTYSIKIPTNLTEEQRELFIKLSKS